MMRQHNTWRAKGGSLAGNRGWREKPTRPKRVNDAKKDGERGTPEFAKRKGEKTGGKRIKRKLRYASQKSDQRGDAMPESMKACRAGGNAGFKERGVYSSGKVAASQKDRGTRATQLGNRFERFPFSIHKAKERLGVWSKGTEFPKLNPKTAYEKKPWSSTKARSLWGVKIPRHRSYHASRGKGRSAITSRGRSSILSDDSVKHLFTWAVRSGMIN